MQSRATTGGLAIGGQWICSVAATRCSVLRKAALSLAVIVAALAAGPGVSKGAEASAGNPRTGEASDALSKPVQAAAEGYQLDTGDHLRIRFYDRYDRDDLNGEYVIGASGLLRLPRIGIFEARNKSTAELERDIRLYVENKGEKLGHFSIDVSLCRPFYVSGLVNRPGSYPFLPGLTVLHAVSLAGGLYHAPMTSATDVLREKRTLTEILGRLVELMARRARLDAERDDTPAIEVPKELFQLDPLRAAQVIDGERTALQRSREALSREKLGLENIIAHTKTESESYRLEMARLSQRIEEQTLIYDQLKTLHEERVINQQRFFEAVSALDALRRDKQSSVAGLSQASANLERAQRDLSMLSLNNKARIAKELAETEQELTRLQAMADQTRELVSALDTLSSQGGSGQVAIYKILRRDNSGRLDFVRATETTPIMPGDVIQVEKKPEGRFWLN